MSVTSHERAMSDGTLRPGFGSIENQAQRDARLALEAAQHANIEDYIKSALGPQLAKHYESAISQSVATGCYDVDWRSGGAFPKIMKYVHSLRSLFLQQQGDVDHLVVGCVRIKAFGTDKEREQLKKLLGVECL